MHRKEEKTTPEHIIRIFEQYLEANSHRRTPERIMVLDCAWELDAPFGAEELSASLEASNRHVADATVYSTLRLMCDCGLICAATHASGRGKRYEFASSMRLNAVCRVCGKTRVLRDAAVEAALASFRLRGMTTEYLSLTAYGTCSACARKNTRKKTKHDKPKLKSVTNNI